MSAALPRIHRNSLFFRILFRILVAAVPIVLLVLLLPAFNAARSSRRHPCLNNLRRLNIAVCNYEIDQGCFPPAYVADEHGKRLHSWRILVLPYLDDPVAHEIYNKYRFDEPWNGTNNRHLAEQIPNVFRCPDEASDDSLDTSYVAVTGAGTMWPQGKGRQTSEVKDGISKTILLIEQPASGIHWMEPRDVTVEDAAIIDPERRRNHATVAFADGHARFCYTLDSKLFRALVTVAGGEEISWEDF